jgi:hypothetical protein
MASSTRVVVLVGLLACLTAGTAGAAQDRARKCQAAKLGAAARAGFDLLRCHARVAKHGGPVELPCVTKALTKLTTVFTRLEQRQPCGSIGDLGLVTARVDGMVTTLLTDHFPPSTTGSRCRSDRIRITGKLEREDAGAYGKFQLGGPGSTLAARILQARTRWTGRVSSETGDCLPSDVLDGAATVVEDAVSRLDKWLFPLCGDGVAGYGEVCDGADTGPCPGVCAATCTCA